MHQLEQWNDRADVLAFGEACDSLFPDLRRFIVEPLVECFAKLRVIGVGLRADSESRPISYIGIRIGCEEDEGFNGRQIFRKVAE